MEGFKPGTLGASLEINLRVSGMQARKNAARAVREHFLDSLPDPVIKITHCTEEELKRKVAPSRARLNPQEQMDNQYNGVLSEYTAYLQNQE
jgi:hypothetical protein